MVDGIKLLHLGHGLTVDRLAHDVPNAAERLGANGHLHGLTGIGGDETTLQALSLIHIYSSEICTIDRGYVRVSDKAMGTVDHTFAVAGGYAQVADDVVTVLARCV